MRRGSLGYPACSPLSVGLFMLQPCPLVMVGLPLPLTGSFCSQTVFKSVHLFFQRRAGVGGFALGGAFGWLFLTSGTALVPSPGRLFEVENS